MKMLVFITDMLLDSLTILLFCDTLGTSFTTECEAR
jgi:hypothetical protein